MERRREERREGREERGEKRREKELRASTLVRQAGPRVGLDERSNRRAQPLDADYLPATAV